MNAMILPAQGRPLRLSELEKPKPAKGQVLVKVRACGICRTDLHVVDGDLKNPKLPLVPGHQIVGIVEALGTGVKNAKAGDRVGIPWLGGSCGSCDYCRSGRENLCDKALYTGYQVNGGFAEYAVADARFVFSIPKDFLDLEAAPLLCAGLIGWRAYKMAGPGKRLGFYGFGAAAHLLTRWPGTRAGKFTPSPGRATGNPRPSLGSWAPYGQEPRGLCPPFPSTRPSSSRPRATWCLRPCKPWPRAGRWSAWEST